MIKHKYKITSWIKKNTTEITKLLCKIYPNVTHINASLKWKCTGRLVNVA